MKRTSKILVAAASLIVIGAVAFAGATHTKSPETIKGQGEQIIMDELSLWNNPANSGISYAAFEPLRVRGTGAEYYFRTDNDGRHEAATGRHYGEIQLTADNGGLLYLPRFLKYDRDDVLKVDVRTAAKQGEWEISLYPSADKVARITKDTPGITLTQNGAWTQVTVPLAKLSYEPFVLQYTEKTSWREANHLLAQYEVPKDDVYGIGFVLKGGKAGDSLYIDHLALEKTTHTRPGILTGKLSRPQSDVEVILRSDKGEVRAKPGVTGAFEITLPQGATMAEIVAQGDDRILSPSTGRFMEIGTYLPPIEIPVGDAVVNKTLASGDTNDSLYIYDEKYGPRVKPEQHFLAQVTTDKDLVVSSELATNRVGYIDQDHRIANPDHAYRVMILGDCHHMGLHIAQSDMWWNEAQGYSTLITKRPVEFISASFNHASWTSSWPAFRDLGADLKPDITLLPMVDPGVLNLVSEEYMMDWLGASKDHRPAYQFELGPDGKLIHKPNDPDWQLYRSVMPDADHQRIRAQYQSTPFVFADDSKTPQWVKDSIKLSTETLKEFGKLAKQRNARFAVLYISNFGSSKKDMIVENGVNYDPNKFRPLMKHMAEQAGVEFIDLSDQIHMQMAGRDVKRVVFANNGHFTPYAHYRYGQALGNMVASWLNVPAAKQ